LAASWAWRDSSALNALALIGLLLTLALLAWSSVRRTASVRVPRVWTYLWSCLEAGVSALSGAIALLLVDVDLRDVRRAGRARRLFAVGRGLLIATPLVLVFGSLLRAADAGFDALAGAVLRVDMEAVASHLALTGAVTWITAGYLRGAVVASGPLIGSIAGLGRLRLGAIEIGLALGLVNLLFLAFVAVQLSYLFGGAAHVLGTDGLTVAEYARRGFFELTMVSALVLPLLLAAHAVLDEGAPGHLRLFRVMATVMLALLGAIMVSALARMRLYTTVFGLTEQRVYATAFMFWLAVVFVWFGVTILRARPERFAFGALIAAYGMLGALHLINPDALIVRTNVARAAAGQPFDASYISELSADAVLPLARALPSLPPAARDHLAKVLASQRDRLAAPNHDWRTWSWGRSRARALLRAGVPGCTEATGCPPRGEPLGR
jgi:hypothetical protein